MSDLPDFGTSHNIENLRDAVATSCKVFAIVREFHTAYNTTVEDRQHWTSAPRQSDHNQFLPSMIQAMYQVNAQPRFLQARTFRIVDNHPIATFLLPSRRHRVRIQIANPSYRLLWQHQPAWWWLQWVGLVLWETAREHMGMMWHLHKRLTTMKLGEGRSLYLRLGHPGSV